MLQSSDTTAANHTPFTDPHPEIPGAESAPPDPAEIWPWWGTDAAGVIVWLLLIIAYMNKSMESTEDELNCERMLRGLGIRGDGA